ncbi:toxin-antitoxin system YwqK family antitoxin [Polaribacter septentrionalilitoris]|uniref:toxin-antitoxin system YwqK family antitoxin n=1 Tax=Polaribacter septentrionalilitoris TaxID=2494657 RepID=UPI00135C08C3|nr:hypothetical protein [Polaribacter septentrionalilitoris]
MKSKFLRIVIILFTAQLTAQTNDLLGKWVVLKRELIDNEIIVQSESYKINPNCIKFLEFTEDGKFFSSDCNSNEELIGDFKYSYKNIFRLVDKGGEKINFTVKRNNLNLEIVFIYDTENGEINTKFNYRKYNSIHKQFIVPESEKLNKLEIYQNYPNMTINEIENYYEKTFYENGELKSVLKRNDYDYYPKEKKLFYDTGELWEFKYFYDDKSMLEITLWKNGNLSSVGKYKNDKRIGNWKNYYKDGELLSTGKFLDGNKNGVWNYYRDGKIIITKNH